MKKKITSPRASFTPVTRNPHFPGFVVSRFFLTFLLS